MASRISLEWLAGVFALAIFLPNIFAATIEARVWTVITPLTITSISARPVDLSEHDDTVIAGHAIRLRDCTFLELRWYLGQRGSPRVPVGVTFLDPPQVRTSGETAWKGIVVLDLTPEQVLRNSHADAVYSCYSGPWASIRSVMPFYDGRSQDVGLIAQK